jgi:hypothetical protein
VLACGLIAVLLLLAGYVLSIGPVYWLVNRDYLPWESDRLYLLENDRLYLPLWWVGERWPAAGDALQSYLDWWAPLSPDLDVPPLIGRVP